jgi:hypothetical protein
MVATNFYSVPSVSAKKSISSNSRTRSKSSNSSASYTRPSKLRTTNCATILSTSSRASSKPRVRSHLHQQVLIFHALMVITRIRLLKPHNHLSQSLNSRAAPPTTEASRSDRSASFRWPLRPPLLPRTMATNTQTIAHFPQETMPTSVRRPTKVSKFRQPIPPTPMLIRSRRSSR